MALFITCRKEWLGSIWAKEKIGNLTNAASRRRIKYYFFYSTDELEMYRDVYESEPSCIVLLSNGGESERRLVSMFKELPMPLIVFGDHKYESISNEISYVMSDTADLTSRILDIFKKKGCKYPAVVGMVSTGQMDSLKIEQFKKMDYSGRGLVFDTESGKLSEAVEKLFKSSEPVDSIICSNDLQAICLIKIFDMVDPDWNKRLLLASYGNTTLVSQTSPSVTTGDFGFDSGSEQVIRIYRTLISGAGVSAMHTIMRHGFIERESTATQSPEGIVFSEKVTPKTETIKESVRRYKKAEKIEKILLGADAVDYRVIRGLMKGEKITDIADDAYCSPGTIKYRIKKYKETVGLAKTAEFSALLNELIDYKKIINH